jgi:hypothetical protein
VSQMRIVLMMYMVRLMDLRLAFEPVTLMGLCCSSFRL